jgi:hypothetical protein
MSDTRNPFVLPETAPPLRRLNGCPKCGEENWEGMNLGGTVVKTCFSCGNKWQGGIGQVPEDHSKPRPPENPKDAPLVDWVMNEKERLLEEVRPRRSSSMPTFRGGALVPTGEDDV